MWRFIRPFLLSERGRAQNDGSFHAALKGHLQRQICMQIFPRSALRVVMQPASRSYLHSAKVRIDLDKSWMKFCKMFDRFLYYASLIFCFNTFSKSFSVPVYDNGTPMGTPRYRCMTMLINCTRLSYLWLLLLRRRRRLLRSRRIFRRRRGRRRLSAVRLGLGVRHRHLR